MSKNDYWDYLGNSGMYDDYLAHYGVLGMKWGQRKRVDNRNIFNLRRDAAITANAYRRAEKKFNDYDRKRGNDGSVKRKALEATVKDLKKRKKTTEKDYLSGHKNYTKAWGREAHPIKRDKLGDIRGRSVTAGQMVKAAGLSVAGTAGLHAAGIPFAYISRPTSTRERGYDTYKNTYGQYKTQYKRERKQAYR